MKRFSLKTLGLLPILALSMTPASFATAETIQVAQMVQTYCTITAGYGSLEVTLYDSPNGEVIVGIDDGETVSFSTSDRSGDWSEVSTSDAVMGWVETQYLVCEDDSAYYEESPDDSAYYEESPDDFTYYEEAPDPSYSEEGYSEGY
jgi:hypothetical protein